MVWCLLVWNSMFTHYPCYYPFHIEKDPNSKPLGPKQSVSSSLYEVLKVVKIPQRLEVSSLQRVGVFVQLPG